ncbi:MAG TPA: DUF1801 domain-containing protein [Blastocatellia bacterium]|nr:DUF1801 domain-containing protein [Blastocatellia bacterium]
MSERPLSYEQYLARLPADRRADVDKVWRLVRENIQSGYTEEIGPKILSFKAGNHWYVALANQKNYISLHLMTVYAFPKLRKKLETATNLKMGKGCINFKRAEDLPLETVAEIVAGFKAEDYIAHVNKLRSDYKAKKKG